MDKNKKLSKAKTFQNVNNKNMHNHYCYFIINYEKNKKINISFSPDNKIPNTLEIIKKNIYSLKNVFWL